MILIKNNEKYTVNNTSLTFSSAEEIFDKIETAPTSEAFIDDSLLEKNKIKQTGAPIKERDGIDVDYFQKEIEKLNQEEPQLNTSKSKGLDINLEKFISFPRSSFLGISYSNTILDSSLLPSIQAVCVISNQKS